MARERIRALATLAVLAAVATTVYWRALDAPFVFDDVPAIVTNPSLARLWPLVGSADAPGPLAPPGLAPTARRPLVNLTFAIDRRFHGLRPAGYRLENVILHVLSAALLAALVRRTLRLPYFAGAWDAVAWPLSLATALLWAVHPLATEAVAYVTQRTELLVALCYLATLWAAVRHWTATSEAACTGWLAVAIVACLAGTASKEIIVSAPLVALLYQRTFLPGARRPWRLVAGLALGWVLLVVLNAGGVHGLSDPRHHVPLHVWWMTQAKVLFLYLRLAVWPWPLSIHYAPTYLESFGAAWPWLAAATALAGATAVLVRRRPAARFVALAVVAVLAPTLVVPLPKMMAAERRMYLPLAGLVTLAAVGGSRLASRRVAAVAAGALVVLASAVTVRRLAAYETAVTIWDDAVRHQPADPMAHYNLGVALVADGRLDDATAHFAEAVRLDPAHTRALDNLGMALHRLGRPENAMAQLEHALALDPDDAVAHNDLAAVLLDLGRPEEALPHLHRALVLEPEEPKATVHLNLGRALLDTGRTDEALAELAEAVRLAPDDADARFSLGVALTAAGRPADAIPHLEAARRLKPVDAGAENALGAARLRAGQAETAAAHFRRALELRPDYAEAQTNLGAALTALGRTDEAIAQFEAAVRSRPDEADAHYNLATALLRSDRPDEAIVHFREALRLAPDDARARFDCALAYARRNEPAEAAALATAALATARSRGEGPLADEIAAWLASRSE